jgi:membrane associated rhomboid family serine protease
MPQTFLHDFYTKSPVSFVLGVLVLLFSVFALLYKKLFLKFILHPFSVVRHKEYYRVFTADLVNADWMHLMLNEFMLYVFCSDLEEALRKNGKLGSLEFLVIYVGSLLLASAVVIARHYRDFEYSSTGTSGSIMGCMFAFMVIAPDHILYHLPGCGYITNIYGGLIYIIMLIIYQRRKKDEYINHEFHFYGALVGAVLGLIIKLGI